MSRTCKVITIVTKTHFHKSIYISYTCTSSAALNMFYAMMQHLKQQNKFSMIFLQIYTIALWKDTTMHLHKVEHKIKIKIKGSLLKPKDILYGCK